jgi:hypothetical protein
VWGRRYIEGITMPANQYAQTDWQGWRRGIDGKAMDVSECATDINTYVMFEALRGVGE